MKKTRLEDFRRELLETGGYRTHADCRAPRRAKNKLQDQLGRSGSSVGANYAESGAAESAKDFIHKLSIALKEAEETDFWLSCLCVEYPEAAEAESLLVRLVISPEGEARAAKQALAVC